MFNLSILSLLLLSVSSSMARLTPASVFERRQAGNLMISRRDGKVYQLEDEYKGEDFFTKWNFWSAPDPTHGSVNYLSLDAAKEKGLAFVDDNGATTLAVDSKTWLANGAFRDSVRISSQKTYSGGLFIADIAKMPWGCSVWPAWWTVGPNWPAGGEIDILEGVNNVQTNQMTLHTSEGCTLDAGAKMSGTAKGTQCATIGGDNTGCAVSDGDTRSYGQAFNDAGGGVFAHLWNADGIKVWHFARADIPGNIQSQQPNPDDGWGDPVAFFPNTGCDIAKHFYEHVLTFNIALCGDWAGNTYASSGCPGTCADAVMNPGNFVNAKWVINSVRVYQ
ncbi:glycoside hydrolase family 16 protein [Mycena floridula]|nr:glycoside hydrolase family 16 protein [Mycena floridula]